jgi:hypothetical protein
VRKVRGLLDSFSLSTVRVVLFYYNYYSFFFLVCFYQQIPCCLAPCSVFPSIVVFVSTGHFLQQLSKVSHRLWFRTKHQKPFPILECNIDL